MKTLTSIGIQKIGQRFVDSVDHADYTLNGVPQTAEPSAASCRAQAQGSTLLRRYRDR